MSGSALLGGTVVSVGAWAITVPSFGPHTPVLLGWTLVGATKMALVVGLVVVYQSAHGITLANLWYAVIAVVSAGAMAGAMIGVHDVRGRAARAALTERKTELGERNERLDQFASVISHDLRNPLTVAVGYTDLARDTPDPETFDRIEEAHERIERMTERLLRLARDGTVAPESLSVATVAEEAWRTVPTGSARLVTEDETISADRDGLAHLFENLFRNAIEHEDADVVRIETREEGFSVVDDGTGFDTDSPERCLEYGNGDGTGIGLSIVRKVADAHRWTITVENDDGVRFVFGYGE